MKRKLKVKSNRQFRHLRIRSKVSGKPERPRLCVRRSLKHFEAQLINDFENRTLYSLSTRDKAFDSKLKSKGNLSAAQILGKAFAEGALNKGIKQAVFDRGGYLYLGRIKAFADAARQADLSHPGANIEPILKTNPKFAFYCHVIARGGREGSPLNVIASS